MEFNIFMDVCALWLVVAGARREQNGPAAVLENAVEGLSFIFFLRSFGRKDGLLLLLS
jgi:hypothetical protein